jgi:uncharacterized protein YjbI with pentapeptide repeats
MSIRIIKQGYREGLLKKARPYQLRARWRTDDGIRRLDAFLAAVRTNRINGWESVLDGFEFTDEMQSLRDLRGADLSKANLRGAELTGTCFADANLAGSDLRDTRLFVANFDNANLTGALLDNADSRGISAVGANLSDAKCRDVDFGESDLTRASLQDACCSGSVFCDTSLVCANLMGCDLRTANLRDADLRFARLVEADLSETVFTGVKLYGSARDGWNLQRIKSDYVYWDKNALERTPKDRVFAPEEFERTYAYPPPMSGGRNMGGYSFG